MLILLAKFGGAFKMHSAITALKRNQHYLRTMAFRTKPLRNIADVQHFERDVFKVVFASTGFIMRPFGIPFLFALD